MNQILSKKSISEIISLTHRECGNKITAEFLDNLKNLGFTYAMKSGASVGLADIVIPEEKMEMVQEAQEEVDEIISQYEQGFITDGERYNKIIDVWTRTTSLVAETMFSKVMFR